MTMNAGRRGIALIVALSLTALLALLATAFVLLAGTERRITRNHLDIVHARLAAAMSAGDAASFARKEKEFTKTVEMLREADGLFRKGPSGGHYAALVDLNGSTIDDLVTEAAGYLQAAAGCIHCTPSSVSDFDDLGRKLMDRAAAFEVRIRTQP
jgi:Tfp pilus assembly protein PilX